MKIGDEILVHGFIDEIRKDTVIVRNDGGYFGTTKDEVYSLVVRCEECKYRDPENKRCDCGALERQGCPFPVNDWYFCLYGERRE